MIFYITLFLSITIDVITKHLASIFLQNQVSLIGDFLYLKYTLNNGIAFSINLPFLKIITLILIFGIFYYYIKEIKDKNNVIFNIKDISFGLILGGAIGNGWERIWFGEVVDMIGVKYFAIFNFADIFITIGVLIFILARIGDKRGKTEKILTVNN